MLTQSGLKPYAHLLRTNCQERPEEGDIGIHEHTSSQSPILGAHHSSKQHRSFASRVVDRETTTYTVGLAAPYHSWKGGREAATAKAAARLKGESACVQGQGGRAVLVKNYGRGCRWLPGRIMEASGPVSFRVRLEDGRLRRCNQDQIRPRLVKNETSEMCG